MTDTRTYWNTGELQAMHAWLNTPGNVQPTDSLEWKVYNAMRATLPPERHRSLKNRSEAKRAMDRMIIAAAKLPRPTAQQATQVPFISPTAPLAPNPQQSMPTVMVNQGASIVVNMSPGKYILEVF